MIEPAKAVLEARAQVLDVGSGAIDLLCHSLDLRLKAFDSGGHLLHVQGQVGLDVPSPACNRKHVCSLRLIVA